MGYIIERGMKLTDTGFRPSADIIRVVEGPGEYEWITHARVDGTPALWPDGKPMRMATPDHKPQTVYATKSAAQIQLGKL